MGVKKLKKGPEDYSTVVSTNQFHLKTEEKRERDGHGKRGL